MKHKIVILYNRVYNNNPDELDVIRQRDLVKEVCGKLNYNVICHTIGNDISGDMMKVINEHPDIVFNLVEDWWGKGELIYFAPAILNSLKIPYTGVPLDALFLTTNKVLAKKMMGNNQIPTACYFDLAQLGHLKSGKTYIVKPVWEEASVGITEDSVFNISEKEKIEKIRQLSLSHYFVEEFIDGREFNISILGGRNGVEVLPPAEMIFSGYFKDKPKVIGYKAKWDEESDEYKHTNRVFNTLEKNIKLKKKLVKICMDCWAVFNLKGYARVDIRLDNNENVYVLEVNGNPCISNNSGFVAAINQAGYSVEMMIKRILEDLN